MLVDSIRNYKTEPVSRFKAADKVYLKFSTGDVEGPYTIKQVYFNRYTRVFMYAFEETSVCCAECYLVYHEDDAPVKWVDCIHEDNSGIADEIVSSFGKLHGGRGINGGLALDFFQPDHVFINWIKDYAAGRLIVDIGCGSGKVLLWLIDAGARACGVDPFWDFELGSKMNMERVIAGQEMIQVISKKIEDIPELVTGKGNKVLLLFCRPCHSNFVINVLNMKDSDTEVLYITIPENMKKYNDLGHHEERANLVPHKGYSVEHEVVYSII